MLAGPVACTGGQRRTGVECGRACIAPLGTTTPIRNGQTLLDVLESCGAAINAGCRAGACGADPIAVTAGADRLAPIGGDERATLQRIGCADNTRLACMARVRNAGPITVELKPHAVGATAAARSCAGRGRASEGDRFRP